MIDELQTLRGVREGAPAPSAAARASARAAWSDGPAALTAPSALPRQRPVRRFAARTVIALAVAAAIVGAGLIITRNRIDSVKPTHVIAIGPRTEPATGQPETFLLVGTDSRAFVHTPAEANEFGDPASATGQRSDTMVLLRVDPGSHRVLAVSLPRDLFIDVPGCGSMKLNAAFNDDVVCGGEHGGAQRLVDTITIDFDVPVDHVVEIGFTGFESLAGDLGGLRIDFPVRERDTYSGLDVTPGCQTLNGAQALSFVRARHVERFIDGMWRPDGASDLERVSDEQLALRQLAAAAIARAGTDPRPLLETLFNNITVDSGFTANDALTLFEALRSDHDATTLTLPVTEHDVGDVAGLALAPGAQNVLDALAGRGALSAPSGPGGSTLAPVGTAC